MEVIYVTKRLLFISYYKDTPPKDYFVLTLYIT